MSHQEFDPVSLEEAATKLRVGSIITVRAPEDFTPGGAKFPVWKKGELVTFFPGGDLGRANVVLFETGGTPMLGMLRKAAAGTAVVETPSGEVSVGVKDILGVDDF